VDNAGATAAVREVRMLDTATRLTQVAADLWRGVDRVDHKAARRRVAQFRARHPDLDDDALHEVIVNAKCVQTGVVGTVSALVGLIPGIGKVAGRVLGPLADATVVTTLQAELVAETFALYDIDLPPQAERTALLAIAASHVGVRNAGVEIARTVARRAEQVLGRGLAGRALPIAQIATAAASHVALTWAIGTRARALCKMKTASAGDWPGLLRDFTLIDERRVVRWATEATKTALEAAASAGRLWLDQLGRLLPEPPRLLGLGAAAEPVPVRQRPARPAGAAPKRTKPVARKPAARKTGASKSTTPKSGAGKPAPARRRKRPSA
jgi:uncharacterized protein (DUF697 family)